MFRTAASRLATNASRFATSASVAPVLRTVRSASAAAAPAVTASAGDDTMPSVSDVTVKINFVDDEGFRREVPGIIGKNLWETAILHGIDIGPASWGHPVEAVRSDTWTEPLYGEGATTGFDHVVLSGNGVDTAKPMDHMEKKMLSEYWDEDELYPESRLASQITLTKDMDGMNVYLPPRLCDDIP